MVLPASYKAFFKKIVDEKETPNLLLYSSTPGSGKTSVAKAICHDIDADYIYINISLDTGIDALRSDIARFAAGKNLSGRKKIVICDEFDGATMNLQKAMRGAIEEYHNTCRFILTCNYVNKIIPALRSRLQEFDFNMTSKEIRAEMLPKVSKRLSMVLKMENIEFKPETVEQIVETYYPDIRKMYGLLQQYSSMNGVIDDNIFSFDSTDEQFYDLIISKKFTQARQFMLDSGYNFDDMYVDLYKNLIPRLDKAQVPQAILTIAEWQYRSQFSVDKEIPFAAMLIELMGNL